MNNIKMMTAEEMEMVTGGRELGSGRTRATKATRSYRVRITERPKLIPDGGCFPRPPKDPDMINPDLLRKQFEEQLQETSQQQ